MGPWAMMALNMQVRAMHTPYVRSFNGFGRPWNHLEELIEDIHVREVALGSGYILTGQGPQPTRRRPKRKTPVLATTRPGGKRRSRRGGATDEHVRAARRPAPGR